MSVRLDTEKADGVDMAVAINFTDLDKAYVLNVKNSVMHYRQTDTPATGDASLVLTQDLFVRMLTGDVGLRETLTSDDLNIEGSVLDLVRFFSLFGEQDGLFNIVTP
jgi:alkyl sulfatase BDS1-like metallo-beta-lactamase superfamily hydrolase